MADTRTKRFLAAMLSTLMFLVTACGSGTPSRTEGGSGAGGAQTITINHGLGTTEVPVNPARVVVFDFGILDTLDKMGVEVVGVPKTGLPSYLEKYADDRYENVGSLKEPDMEKISALQPDLIIISGRQGDYYEELSGIAPTIYLELDFTRYWDSFQENMRTLAAIFDRKDWMDQQLAQIDQQVEAVQEKVGALDGKGLIVLVTGGKISAYGPGGRFGLIHDVLGVAPADPNIEASTHGMSVSLEYIAETNPDFLFVIDRDQAVGTADQGQSAAQVLDNPLVHGTNAYKNGKIIYLDPSYWYLSGGGLVSTAAMVDEVARGLGVN